jgi:hypothetical protein
LQVAEGDRDGELDLRAVGGVAADGHGVGDGFAWEGEVVSVDARRVK